MTQNLEENSSNLPVSRRSLVIGGALLACAGLSFAREPVRQVQKFSDKNFEALFPEQVGPWSARNSADLILPPPDQLSQKLYEQLATRLYEGEDLPSIMMLTAYSSIQQNNVQVHRPEVCYPAAGFTITENIILPVKINENLTIPARFLVAEKSGRSEMIIYWTRVGNSYPLRWIDQRVAMAEANLRGFFSDGALVRFSLLGLDQAPSIEALENFIRIFFKSAQSNGRKTLFGSA